MRKRRTREHIIADLSINHLERFVLRAGHVVHRTVFDYGYDLYLYTFTGTGEVEPGYGALQVKATESPRYVGGGEFITVTLERRELEHWLAEPLPVFLVLYDAQADSGFWAHVQDHFWDRITGITSDSVTLRLACSNPVNLLAIQQMRTILRNAIRRMETKNGTH